MFENLTKEQDDLIEAKSKKYSDELERENFKEVEVLGVVAQFFFTCVRNVRVEDKEKTVDYISDLVKKFLKNARLVNDPGAVE